MSKKRCPRFSRMALLDLRAWVAAMFFVFGTMLAVYGAFFADGEDLAKAAGTNLDLWTGVGMIVFAAAFAVWLLARPPEFDVASDAEEAADGVVAANGVDGLLAEAPGAEGSKAQTEDGEAQTEDGEAQTEDGEAQTEGARG